MPHKKTFSNIVETTFNTPLVKLSRIVPAGAATVLLKLEFFNPLSSVKDRIGRAMIEAAEKRRHPEPGRRTSSSLPAATRASPWPLWRRPGATGSR